MSEKAPGTSGMSDNHQDLQGQEGRQLVAAAANRLAERGYGQLGPAIPDLTQSENLNRYIREYFRILLNRKGLILSITAACVAIGAFRVLTVTPEYTSTLRLQIDRTVAKVIDSGATGPAETGDPEYMRTQYELLLSRNIAERAVSELNLGADADFLKPRSFSLVGTLMGLFQSRPANPSQASQEARDRAAIGVVLGHRAMKPVTGSRLVDLSYTDPNPGRAQRVVTGLANAFIHSLVDKRFEANAFAKNFIEDKLKQLQLRVQESENVVLDFGQKEQIIQTSEKSSIAENNLAAANTTLSVLITERIRNEQLWKQIENADAISSPQFLNNPVIGVLRAQRNALVTDYQEKLETFKPSYPAMVQISNRIKETEHQLASEVETIKRSLKAAYQSTFNQEQETKKRVDNLRAEVLDLQKRSIQYNLLKREAETNRTLYDNLLQRYKEVDVAGGIGQTNVFVVESANLPGSASSPRVLRDIGMFLLFGLLIGLVAAIALEKIDDRVRSIEDMEDVTGLPTLGIIPKLGSERNVEAELFDVRSELSEAYRSLCTSLHFATEHGLPKTLLITSASAGEGKSTSSIAIARHFATLGMRVLLIDADLRKPSLHEKLGVDNSHGLTNYLTGNATPPETFQKTSVPNLTFMSSGPLPPNAADLLSGSRFLSLLAVGMEAFGLIVIDGPPVMGLADAQILSSAAAATVFTVGAGKVRKNAIRVALKRLQFARGLVIGSLLTRHEFQRGSYGYGYGYGYGYDYGKGVTGQVAGAAAQLAVADKAA
jgi:capsular exopolysaccharide synthesis family protein